MKSKMAALCLCAAMVLGSLLVSAPVKAADTSNTLVVDIRGPTLPGAAVFNDVVWTPDGKYALFVGAFGGYGVAWWYNPAKVGDAAWTQATLVAGNPFASTFKTVIYNPYKGFYNIMGDATLGYWYRLPGFGANLIETFSATLPLCTVEDMVQDNTWGVFAVGWSGSNAYFLRFDNDDHWGQAAVAIAGNWFSCELYNNKVYCAGSDGGTGGQFGYYPMPTFTYFNIVTTAGFMFSDMALDTFDYDRFILTTKGRSVQPMGLWEAKDTDMNNVVGLAPVPTNYEFNAIDIQDDGFAVAVGRDTGSGNGLVYDIWWTGATTSVMKRSTTSPPYSGQTFKGVAIRPTGVQMALIAGSAFKYSYTSVLAPIQVDTAVPHIDYIDVYPTGSGTASSVLNSQSDVDIGDSSTSYTVEIRIYDNLGVGRMTSLDVWLWYDEGNVTTDFPALVTPTFDTLGHENTRMHFTIDSASAWTQQYPTPGPTEETTLTAGAWTPIDGTSAVIVLNFSPHQQVRAAAGPFTESLPNMRYDPDFDGPEAQEQSTINALNDDLTWDIKARVADDAPTTNYASAYDEFGFYKYTYLSAANIPNGGAVYGSGAPGTNNVVMTQSGSDVTFCANCPYALSVTLASDLFGVAVPTNWIAASQISVRGGEVAAETAFIFGGSTITLIGGPQAPLNSLPETTTSSWDGNAGTSEAVFWEVNIPAVPEDSYVSTILWAITN